MGDRISSGEHYLRRFKQILDNAYGKAPLHVCLEAAHPTTLGRSSDLIMQLVRYEQFDELGMKNNDKIKIHFIPDRLSVPKLNGHVLAIGGPRSNVVARIAMEYEATLHTNSAIYRRNVAHCFPLEYAHIHRDDYEGRLFSEMDTLDPIARAIIHHYYPLLDEAPYQGKVNLFSVNRYLRRKHKQWKNDRKLPSLSAIVKEQFKTKDKIKVRKTADHTIYDHFVETIMPNVLCKEWGERPLIIYHGLRALGTFAALSRLSDETFLAALEKRISALRRRYDRGEFLPTAFQTGWSVIRPLGRQFGLLEEDEALLQMLTKQESGFATEYENLLNEFLAIKCHAADPHAAVTALPQVPKREIERFREGLIEQRVSGASKWDQRTVKLDQINEQQILDAMSLQRDKHFRRHDIYVLGCFERKKTVYTQQSRALTLIHALYKAGKILPGTKIGIVGGGISGMTAAIAASETGARVVLCEREDKLVPVQKDCDHRTLHPYFYDWPRNGSERKKTDFPISEINWSTDTAKTVFANLVKAYENYEREANALNDRQQFNTYTGFQVNGYHYDRLNKKHILTEYRFPKKLRKKARRKPSQSERKWKKKITKWWNKYAKYTSSFVREAREAGGLGVDLEQKKRHRKKSIDCDIVIFATGYGREDARAWLDKNNIDLPDHLLLNNSYWENDHDHFPSELENGGIFVVSGAGDGALIDILRLCIREFEDPEWHAQFIERMNGLTRADQSGAVWSNRREVLLFAHALKDLFDSDEFKLIGGEKDRLAQIESTLTGFDIDAFLDAFAIELNNVEVYNVSIDPQPFWADSAIAHRLLIWCLYKKGKVRFVRGAISDYKDGALVIERLMMAKERLLDVKGVVIRHGVVNQNTSFLDIPGLLYRYEKDPQEIARDGERLVSLLRLSNELHPETEKFFRHTIKNLRSPPQHRNQKDS